MLSKFRKWPLNVRSSIPFTNDRLIQDNRIKLYLLKNADCFPITDNCGETFAFMQTAFIFFQAFPYWSFDLIPMQSVCKHIIIVTSVISVL